MVIMLAILGLIVGVYVVVLVRGHLATKKVLSALEKTGNHPEGRENDNHKNHFDGNSD
jgi:hypothetical protein